MSTSKNSKTIVSLFIVVSLSAFLYINLGNSVTTDSVNGIPATEKTANDSTTSMENAGLLPEVELIKRTLSKLKEIKPLFEVEKSL